MSHTVLSHLVCCERLDFHAGIPSISCCHPTLVQHWPHSVLSSQNEIWAKAGTHSWNKNKSNHHVCSIRRSRRSKKLLAFWHYSFFHQTFMILMNTISWVLSLLTHHQNLASHKRRAVCVERNIVQNKHSSKAKSLTSAFCLVLESLHRNQEYCSRCREEMKSHLHGHIISCQLLILPEVIAFAKLMLAFILSLWLP
jgi:hypothetical protein